MKLGALPSPPDARDIKLGTVTDATVLREAPVGFGHWPSVLKVGLDWGWAAEERLLDRDERAAGVTPRGPCRHPVAEAADAFDRVAARLVETDDVELCGVRVLGQRDDVDRARAQVDSADQFASRFRAVAC